MSTTTLIQNGDPITEDPDKQQHVHRGVPQVGCEAACGRLFENTGTPNQNPTSPCPKCMELALAGLID